MPTPAPPRPSESAPADGLGAGPWHFAWGAGAQRYLVRSEAEVARGSERERVESEAQVTLAVQPAGSGGTRAISGRVDSLRVRASERVAGTAAAPPSTSVAVRGTIAARGAVRLESDAAAAGCASAAGAAAATALGLAREAVPRVPATLSVGARWADTTSVAGCAGPLPVTVRAVSAYEVEGAAGGAVRVRRRTTSTVRGQGFAGGQSVRVQGSGSAEALLLLDPVRGALREVTGEGRATFSTTVGAAAQTFEQRTRVRVSAVNGGSR